METRERDENRIARKVGLCIKNVVVVEGSSKTIRVAAIKRGIHADCTSSSLPAPTYASYTPAPRLIRQTHTQCFL